MSAHQSATARYEPEANRLRLVFAGEVDSAAYRACMEGWLHSVPEAAAADWLYDLGEYRGSVTHEDVTGFARAPMTPSSARATPAPSPSSSPPTRASASGCRPAPSAPPGAA